MLQDVWPDLKAQFGQTGTSKVLSLLSPELFVMWDQDIRTRRRRKQGGPAGTKRDDRGVYFYMEETGFDIENNSTSFGRTAEDYLTFLRYCQEVLEDVGSCPIAIEHEEKPPAKLLDEAFYAFYKIENADEEP